MIYRSKTVRISRQRLTAAITSEASPTDSSHSIAAKSKITIIYIKEAFQLAETGLPKLLMLLRRIKAEATVSRNRKNL